MINFILRKTVLKKFSKESQDWMLPMLKGSYLISFLSIVLNIFIFNGAMIPIVILLINAEESAISTIIAVIFMFLYEAVILFFTLFFNEGNFILIQYMKNKLHFTLLTRKGKALTKEDFKLIERKNNKLYNFISTNACHGYCYSICFNLLKTLQKGSLKFIAVKNNEEDEDFGTFPYTMHVLYVHNGWVFDTYNQRQYPVEKAIKLHKGFVYKDFTYEDIEDLTYEEFYEKNCHELIAWCKGDNCSQDWYTE